MCAITLFSRDRERVWAAGRLLIEAGERGSHNFPPPLGEFEPPIFGYRMIQRWWRCVRSEPQDLDL